MPEGKPGDEARAPDDTVGTSADVKVSRVVLTGFMGAGKSTVGALLAAALGWQFVDVDVAIEAVHGASIAALFSQHGEAWFRQVERETILAFLATDRLVLALGGGAIEDDETRAALLASQGTYLVHLEASFETVLVRCRGTEDLRPILRDRRNLESRYLRRLPLYRQAHLSLPVDALDPEMVAAKLVYLLPLP